MIAAIYARTSEGRRHRSVLRENCRAGAGPDDVRLSVTADALENHPPQHRSYPLRRAISARVGPS